MGSNVSTEQSVDQVSGNSSKHDETQHENRTSVRSSSAVELKESSRMLPFSLSQKSRLELITLHCSLRSKLGERTKTGDILPVTDWFEEFEYILDELAPLESPPLSLLNDCVSEDLRAFLVEKQFTSFNDAKAGLFSHLSRTVSSEEQFQLLVHQKDVPARIAIKRLRELLLPENRDKFFIELLLHSLSEPTATKVRKSQCNTLDDCFNVAEAIETGEKQGFCRSRVNVSLFTVLPKCILQQIVSYLEFKDMCSLLTSSVELYKLFPISHYKYTFANGQFSHNNANDLSALMRIKKSDRLLMFGVLTNSHDQGWASNRQSSYTWIELDVLKPRGEIPSAETGEVPDQNPRESLLPDPTKRVPVYTNKIASNQFQKNFKLFKEHDLPLRVINEYLKTHQEVDVGVYVRSQYPGWLNFVNLVEFVCLCC